MNRTLFCTAVLFFCAIGMKAVNIDCTPGALPTLVSNPASVTELTLTGSVDASDLNFISTQMPELKTLDMGGVSISAYSGDKKINGQKNFEANMIPTGAFASSKISSVVLPSTPGLYVADMAFASSQLTAMVFPANVTRTGYGIFADCDKLTTATLSANPGEYAFANCKALETVTLNGVTVIAEGMFKDCSSLKEVAGSQNVTSIGSLAFANCTELKSFNFGAGLQSIGQHAFSASDIAAVDAAGCSKLTTLGAWAFADCPALTSVNLPSGLHQSGEGAFAQCPKLETFESSLQDVADYALKGSAVDSLVVAEGTSNIGAYALKDINSDIVVLPSTLTSMGDGAMENASNLSKIYANTLTTVPQLGNDVWRGVAQSGVDLETSPEMESTFKSTPQWMEFNVKGTSTLIEPIIAESARVSVRYIDHVLQIRSHSLDLESVEIFSVAGELLLKAPLSGTVEDVDLSGLNASVLVVRINLEGDITTVLKLAAN